MGVVDELGCLGRFCAGRMAAFGGHGNPVEWRECSGKLPLDQLHVGRCYSASFMMPFEDLVRLRKYDKQVAAASSKATAIASEGKCGHCRADAVSLIRRLKVLSNRFLLDLSGTGTAAILIRCEHLSAVADGKPTLKALAVPAECFFGRGNKAFFDVERHALTYSLVISGAM